MQMNRHSFIEPGPTPWLNGAALAPRLRDLQTSATLWLGDSGALAFSALTRLKVGTAEPSVSAFTALASLVDLDVALRHLDGDCDGLGNLTALTRLQGVNITRRAQLSELGRLSALVELELWLTLPRELCRVGVAHLPTRLTRLHFWGAGRREQYVLEASLARKPILLSKASMACRRHSGAHTVVISARALAVVSRCCAGICMYKRVLETLP
jgi:hypothetical protein